MIGDYSGDDLQSDDEVADDLAAGAARRGASEQRNLWTPGPWSWFGSTKPVTNFYLATVDRGRRYVMGFRRAGMQEAEPTFLVDGRMVLASELVRYDVARHVKGKTAAATSPDVYRQDFSEIDHPDARLIAAAPEMAEKVQKLLDLIDRAAPRGWREHADPDGDYEAARALLARIRGEAP